MCDCLQVINLVSHLLHLNLFLLVAFLFCITSFVFIYYFCIQIIHLGLLGLFFFSFGTQMYFFFIPFAFKTYTVFLFLLLLLHSMLSFYTILKTITKYKTIYFGEIFQRILYSILVFYINWGLEVLRFSVIIDLADRQT